MRTVSLQQWLANARSTLAGDARIYQILSLSLLLGYGKCCLQFDIGPGQIATTLASALLAQYVCGWLAAAIPNRQTRNPKSEVRNNPENSNKQNTANDRRGLVCSFPPFGPLNLFRISIFGFRISPHALLAQKSDEGGSRFTLHASRFPPFDPKSALITGLSLCLLLRTNSLLLAAATAFAAIGSKLFLRWNGKHVFNPANFGLVAAMLWAGGKVWVSPGQWGNAAFFGFLMVCLGGLVVHRAARADVTLSFLGFYLALVFGRSWWLGEPTAIPLHRLQNGALLLFAFFMISDPKTTPDSRPGRILFALLVALGAAFVQFKLFRTNGLLWSLAVFSLATPLLDRLLPGPRYRWPGLSVSKPQKDKMTTKGPVYEPMPA